MKILAFSIFSLIVAIVSLIYTIYAHNKTDQRCKEQMDWLDSRAAQKVPFSDTPRGVSIIINLDSECCKVKLPSYMKIVRNGITGDYAIRESGGAYLSTVADKPDENTNEIGFTNLGDYELLRTKDTCHLKRWAKAYLDHMDRRTFK